MAPLFRIKTLLSEDQIETFPSKSPEVTARPFLFFPPGQIQLERLLVISGVTVCISLFLSFLWTLDDTGISYANRKDQEIKMIGKFVGTLMRILIGGCIIKSVHDASKMGWPL
jgi:hypothetical protein